MRISNTKEKFISFYGGKFNVQKNINGKSVLFARFDNLEDAIKHRNYCNENEWKIEICKLTKNTLRDGKYKYIYKIRNGHYVVRKNGIHYGVFKKYEDAIKHRDYCVENEWNKKCIYSKRKKYNKYNLPKYITYCKQSKRYVVSKEDKNTLVRIADYKNLEDALHDRDLLIKVNWDEDKLFELDEIEGSLW